MVTSNDLPWTTVVARGSSAKVISPKLPESSKNSEFKMISTVMYEHEDLHAQMLARKATAIVKQALTSDSVLFSFPSLLFPHRTVAYAEIEKQCGPIDGVRPINLYGQRGASGDLLVEVSLLCLLVHLIISRITAMLKLQQKVIHLRLLTLLRKRRIYLNV
jgi:hypothetical protein